VPIGPTRQVPAGLVSFLTNRGRGRARAGGFDKLNLREVSTGSTSGWSPPPTQPAVAVQAGADDEG